MEWECHNCGHQHSTLPDRCQRCGTAPEVVLNRWRCQHCGQEEIPGTDVYCPVCKAAKAIQGESRVDASSQLHGAQALALARGSWRYCAYCDVQVPPVNEQGQANEMCPNCQGPLSEAESEAAVQEVSAQQAAGYQADLVQQVGAAPAPAAPTPAPAPTPRRSRLGCFVFAGLALVGLVVGVYFLVFHTWEKNLTVASRTWQRTIEIEKFGPVAKEAWRAKVPGDAYNRSCRRKIHHHDKVPDGQETYKEKVSTGRTCASYGYKKKGGVSVKKCTRWKTNYKTVTKTRTRYRKVAVYRKFCRFKVDRWHHSRDLMEDGDGDDEPAWPDTDALDDKKERAGAKAEEYTLVLKKKDKETIKYKCSSQAQWKKYPAGSAVVAEMTTLGKIKKLKPAK